MLVSVVCKNYGRLAENIGNVLFGKNSHITKLTAKCTAKELIVSWKSGKCSSQQVLIKHGQYVGVRLQISIDRPDYKKQLYMLSCTNATRYSLCSGSNAPSMHLYLRLAEKFVAAYNGFLPRGFFGYPKKFRRF